MLRPVIALTHAEKNVAKDLGNCSMCINSSSEGEPHAGKEAIAPSIIIRKREVQRREETPPNGGVVTPEDIQMQPFIPKGKLNSILNF